MLLVYPLQARLDVQVLDRDWPEEHCQCKLPQFAQASNLTKIVSIKRSWSDNGASFHSPARSMAPRAAMAPRLGADKDFKLPLKQPTGVRTALAMTTS